MLLKIGEKMRKLQIRPLTEPLISQMINGSEEGAKTVKILLGRFGLRLKWYKRYFKGRSRDYMVFRDWGT